MTSTYHEMNEDDMLLPQLVRIQVHIGPELFRYLWHDTDGMTLLIDTTALRTWLSEKTVREWNPRTIRPASCRKRFKATRARR